MIAAILAGLMTVGSSSGHLQTDAQSPRDAGCNEWHTCRAMALAAADRGEYETFHDLAWRTVQTGPRNDPALMYLLARAQALSGRPHDALVMLDRLAKMGVFSDAATNDDFIRTRQLPAWPEVAARIERLGAPGSTSTAKPVAAPPVAAPATPTPTTPVTPPPAAPAHASAAGTPAAPVPAPLVEAARFSIGPRTVVGLAYDTVSRRFLFGDRLGRKLVVVSEGSNQPLDLVRADSAGFQDISAIEIDDARGDLWVASAADGDGTLHRLQLVSGRPLKTFRIAQDAGPVSPVDLAITRSGTVLVLDAANGRILALRPGASALHTLVRIDLPSAVSLAVGADDAIAYVAHRDGISRIDLRGRTAARVAAPKDVALAGLQQIRWHRNALIGVTTEDGSSRIVRFDLNASGRGIKRATTIEPAPAIAGPGSLTVSGDDLLYLARSAVSDVADLVAYRINLRR
jgi:hypothetical protein